MDIRTLVNITSRAWALPILSLMHSGVPGRQAALLTASGASRTAFSQSLKHLIDLGLVERNAGHGHPMRPEFRLTQDGIEMAAMAYRIKRTIVEPSDHLLLRRAWSIPVLVASQTPQHFSEIKTSLTTITDRALSLSLKQLHAQNWIERSVRPTDYPIRPRYFAANIGKKICQAVNLDIA